MKKTLSVLLVVVLIGIGAAYVWHAGAGQTAATAFTDPIAAASGAAVELSASSSPEASGAPQVASLPRTPPTGYAEYQSPHYHFSLFYPEAMQYKEEPEAGGQALLVVFQNPGTGEGFQIYIQPYALPTITKERFALDEPSGIEQNPVAVAVDGAQGIMFASQDPVIGAIREIWFIDNGFLYEVTTAMSFDASMQHIMQSWKAV